MKDPLLSARQWLAEVADYQAVTPAVARTHLRNALAEVERLRGALRHYALMDWAPDSDERGEIAREALGLTKYKAGDLTGALADFEAVLADPLVSREAQSRLAIFVAQLTVQGQVCCQQFMRLLTGLRTALDRV